MDPSSGPAPGPCARPAVPQWIAALEGLGSRQDAWPGSDRGCCGGRKAEWEPPNPPTPSQDSNQGGTAFLGGGGRYLHQTLDRIRVVLFVMAPV